jgi:hypothetical protein
MARSITPDMLERDAPSDVLIRTEPRQPESDPTLGISVTVDRQGTPKHRLVSIGDSLSHGFQSGAIFKTDCSCPAIIAKELGWQAFRYPTYESPGDGLPLNVETLARELEARYKQQLNWWEIVPALLLLRGFLDKTEDFWERGKGAEFSNNGKINHDLAVYGWDLRNTLERTADTCLEVLQKNQAKDDFLKQAVDHHNERAAIRVLNSARDASGKALTPLQAAQALGAEGTQETNTGTGIETLILFIGSNNALGSILTFNVAWSGDGYDNMDINDRYTVWRPIHFKAELDLIVQEVENIQARHVIWCTIPHVTIAPFARGIGEKIDPHSRYFPYYTLPWLTEKTFNPNKHPHLTSQDVRAIDSAIDQYNDAFTEVVRHARHQGKNWYLYDTAGLFDRLAIRRFFDQPQAQPDWWTPYELPPELQALTPIPDARFFISNKNGRIQGGLTSLDGIHPTTIGYGILAQELINVMQLAGVTFYDSQGQPRSTPIRVDFNRLIALDSLISQPPSLIKNLLELIGGFDSTFNIMSRLLKSNY